MASVDIKAAAKEHVGYVPQLLIAYNLSGCDTVSYLWGDRQRHGHHDIEGGQQVKQTW